MYFCYHLFFILPHRIIQKLQEKCHLNIEQKTSSQGKVLFTSIYIDLNYPLSFILFIHVFSVGVKFCFSIILIIIIISLFQEDNIFGTNASLTYGPRLQR